MNRKKNTAGSILVAVVAASTMLVQSCTKDDPSAPLDGGAPQVSNLRQYDELTIDVGAVLNDVRAKSGSMIDLRLATAAHPTWDLEVTLKPVEPDAEFYVDDVQQPMPEVRTLTGFRKGSSDPCVITVAEGWFSGVFKENGVEYFIQARRDFDHAATDDQFVVYRAEDVIDPGPTGCATDHLAAMRSDVQDDGGPKSTCKKVDLTVVADPQFRATYSSSANCLAAMTTQVNNASYCYWNNSTLLLDLRVSKSYIYTSGTYFTSTNASTLLGQLRTWGNASSSRRSDINFLFTGKTLQSNIAGIAYLGVACANPTYSYALGEKMSTTAYWRNLIAHETGHNFNAPHYSSGIMQSMVTTSNTFASSSKSTILSFSNAHSSCYTTGTCN